MRQPDPKVQLASGEYDRRVQVVRKQVSVRQVAQLFSIPPNRLRNYRANYVSRKGR